jgi:hypothetical protein
MTMKKNDTIPSLLKKNKDIEKSRDNWKEKNHERYDEIKALKARKNEVESSRDKWKVECKKKNKEVSLKESLIKALEEQLVIANISAEQRKIELDDFKKKLHEMPLFEI